MTNIKYLILTTVLCAAFVRSSVFADEEPNENTIPIKLVDNANTKTIDVGVSETVNVTYEVDTNNLIYDAFEIVNYSSLNQITVDNIKTVPQNGWEIVTDKTNFLSLNNNSEKYSIVLVTDNNLENGYSGADFDFSTRSGLCTLTPGDVIADAEGSTILNFKGNIGTQTEDISKESIIDVIVTLSIY